MTPPEQSRRPLPVGAVLGSFNAPTRAVVLSPVLPMWDGGTCLASAVAPLLAAGHQVTIYDTMSLWRPADDLIALADRWSRHLAPIGTAPGPQILAGNALGGAVVQAMLDRVWTHRCDVVLLSGPTVADAALDTALENIAEAAASNGLDNALRLLGQVVQGPGEPPETAPAAEAPALPASVEATQRLSSGLRLLHAVDARRAVQRFPGRLLHVYGDQSRLVRREHLAAGPEPRHRRIGIPCAGMRPHRDQPDLVRTVITEFIQEAAHS